MYKKTQGGVYIQEKGEGMIKCAVNFITFMVICLLSVTVVNADVVICGENGEMALESLTPGEDLLLCPDVVHNFGGVYRLGDMQGSEVRSTDPTVLARTTGTLNFSGAATRNLTFTGIDHTGSGSSHGFRFDNGTSDITIQDSIIQQYAVGVYVKKRNGSDTVWNIKLYRNLIQNNLHQGVLGGGPGYEIINNTFLDNGSNGVYDHGIYFGCGDPGDGSPCPQLIKGNYISGSSRSGSGACQGTQIVAHGYLNETVVENNVIIEPDGNAVSTCYGIGLTECCGQESTMSNITIRNNVIVDNGRIGITLRGVTGADVHNNIIYHHSGRDVGGKVAIQAQPSDSRPGTTVPTGDMRIFKNIIDMSGRVNSGIWIWEGVSPPISIANNRESYDTNSIFDLNEDGGIGPDDIGILLSELGTTSEKSDLNSDGAVGLDDLGLLLHLYSAIS